ncbi:MAG: hypothetical protein ACFWTK_10220 [Clostridium sp.]|jgi:hypothetical protein
MINKLDNKLKYTAVFKQCILTFLKPFAIIYRLILHNKYKKMYTKQLL